MSIKSSPNRQRSSGPEPFWYKKAIIYEVHVRAFFDMNGDGIGDFRGLTAKLDYLRELGVNAIWLLPFYPSPLKDDGYDIADYYNVHPRYGTLADFRNFLHEAHRRGLRVITELVLNHTSDQHPWFQRARHAEPGSRLRDYYVWSETPETYKEARIIFKDTEISNWTWDPVAKSYFWHRFYSHQPDLNFDNPVVHQELLRVVDFWFGMSVDGVRLDAVPYLYEREGTSCENLPETHEFLKKLRKHVDEKFGPGRMLLAEANQWPEDAVAYFGEGAGNECHMAFHFPLMPRLFMALGMEDRVPIVDILEQTPPIPETAQWALFLRNHDELTLEMVTDEERDYMYRSYASMQQARLNLGIRRRLAPLLGNDRRRLELMVALLFSLPGTPVLYYGDEIGMGGNIYLGDRNGVRTPMQWSADKNAGFSRANPQSLYLPINIDPENHYEAVNVEVQERNPMSLLWWMKRVIALRKRWQAFGLGTLEFLQPENRKVIAFIRRFENERVLVVANLSRFAQPVELNLAAYQSLVPMELFGRTKFPAITDKPYFLTLSPHGFHWFSLEAHAPEKAESTDGSIGAGARRLLSVQEDWEETVRPENQYHLEEALQAWLPTRRWFTGKNQTIEGLHITEVIPVSVGGERILLTFLQVDYTSIEPEMYVLPMAFASGKKADTISTDWPSAVIAHMTFAQGGQQDGIIYDAIVDDTFHRALLDLISSRRRVEGGHGALHGSHATLLRPAKNGASPDGSTSHAGQNHSTIVFDDKLILKLFRRLDTGINPELELGRFLTERNFPYSPPVVGALEYRNENGEPITLAVVNKFIPQAKTAWDYTMDSLGRFYEQIQTVQGDAMTPPTLSSGSIAGASVPELPKSVREFFGAYLDNAGKLGECTAALHLALSSAPADAAFAPEPLTPHAQRGLFQSMRNLTRAALQSLKNRMTSLAPELQPQAKQIIEWEPEILKRFRSIYLGPLNAVRIRHHGDFHLENVLYDGKNFWIVDFEGEPSIPLSERRLKHSALRDVASMVRSFHYAAHVALRQHLKQASPPPQRCVMLEAWARFWRRWVSVVYYQAYCTAAGEAAFLPGSAADRQIILDAYILRKAIYELGAELNQRPDWVAIPLEGIVELVNASAVKGESK